jgi:hypothetical protein
MQCGHPCRLRMMARALRVDLSRALTHVKGWLQPHKDKVFEVDKAIDVMASMSAGGYSLTLTKATREKLFSFTCYLLIG